MDDKATAVLERYHQRMRDEGERMRSGQMGSGDWRDQVLLAVGPDDRPADQHPRQEP